MKRKSASNSIMNGAQNVSKSQSIPNSVMNGPKRKRRKLSPPSLIALDSNKNENNQNDSSLSTNSQSQSPNIPIFCMIHCMKIHYASNLDKNKYDKCQMCLEENNFDSMHFIYQCTNCKYYVCNFCFGELYQKNKTSFSPQIINHYHKNIKTLKLNGNQNGNRSRSKSRSRKSRAKKGQNVDKGSSSNSKSKSKRVKTKNNNKNGSRYRYNSEFKEHGIKDKNEKNGHGMKLRSSDDTDYSFNDDQGSIASRTRNSRRKTRRNQQNNVSYH